MSVQIEATPFELAQDLMEKDAIDEVQASNKRIVIAKSHLQDDGSVNHHMTESEAEAFWAAINDVLGETMWVNEWRDQRGAERGADSIDPELGVSTINRAGKQLTDGPSESQASFVK